jgi:hypothetical protein
MMPADLLLHPSDAILVLFNRTSHPFLLNLQLVLDLHLCSQSGVESVALVLQTCFFLMDLFEDLGGGGGGEGEASEILVWR